MKKYFVFCFWSSVLSAQIQPPPIDLDPVSTTYYRDYDMDGYGNPNETTTSTLGYLPGYVSNALDCDDTNYWIHPNTRWYADDDRNGFGDPDDFSIQCTKPEGNYVLFTSNDCENQFGEPVTCYEEGTINGNYNYIRSKTYTSPEIIEQIEDLVLETPVSSGTITARNSIVLKPGFRATGNITFAIDTTRIVPSTAKSKQTIRYFDGLGKPIQNIAVKESPTQKDIVQHIEYDAFGIISKNYLPYASTLGDGELVLDAKDATISYYKTLYNDSIPYTETFYDSSPLNKVTEVATVGQDFTQTNARTHKLEVRTNNQTNRRLKRFTPTSENGIPNFPDYYSYYPDDALLVHVEKDENWIPEDGRKGTVESYKDLSGKLIATRAYDASETPLTTYYVYDKLDRLVFVIPPIAEEVLLAQNDEIVIREENIEIDASHLIVNPTGNETCVVHVRTKWMEDVLVAYNIQFELDNLSTSLKEGTISLPYGAQLPDQDLFSYIGKDILAKFTFEGELHTAINYDFSCVHGMFDVEIRDFSGATVIDNDVLESTHHNVALTVPASENSFFSYNDALFQNYCYQYRYDIWNRLVEKKIPGKEWEYFVYDANNRPVLTQDGNLRADNLWTFSKFDIYDRPVYAGLYSSSSDRNTLQAALSDFETEHNKSNSEERTTNTLQIGQIALNYDNKAFPTSGITEVLSVNYYDDYNFYDADKPGIPINVLGQQVTQRTNTLQTASWIKTLGKSSWEKTTLFYDEKARPIKIVAKNHLGGSTELENQLDFTGMLLQSISRHKKGNSDNPIMIRDSYTYDEAQRLLKHEQQINNQTKEVIVENSYDELGTRSQKKVGGSQAPLQTVDYGYSIQGTLRSLNDTESSLATTPDNDLFAYKLNYYNALEGARSNANYNGNLSQVIWRSVLNDKKHSYCYAYDKLNRLQSAHYGTGSDLSEATGQYNLESLLYDANGNIVSLRRTGANGLIDDLSYDYSDSEGNTSNQLSHITDTTGNTEGYAQPQTQEQTYTYDTEGRLVSDASKGITEIVYNYLNLPELYRFESGDTLEMVYNAAGTLLEKVHTTTQGSNTALYLDGFYYQNDNLLFFGQPEGYVYKDGAAFSYAYIYADHLGNNRLCYADLDGDGTIQNDEILSLSDYYPMGMLHPGEMVSNSAYNFKFQGKELENAGGLGQYHFGARIYDPVLGRWWTPDPKAESFYSDSPFAAMGNNYAMMVDPNGENPLWGYLIYGLFVTTKAIVNDEPIEFDFSASVSHGSNGFSANANVSLDAEIGDFTGSAGFGLTYHSNFYTTGVSGFETRTSFLYDYDDGHTGFSLGTNDYGGFGGMEEFNQRLGILKFRSGDFRFAYENDGFPFQEWYFGYTGDGNDSYRTAGAIIGIKEFSVQMNLLTGKRTKKDYEIEKKEMGGQIGEPITIDGILYKHGLVHEQGPQYRYGGLTLNYKGISAGVNSEWIRHTFQNQFAHGIIKKQRYFQVLDKGWYPAYNFSNLPTSKFSIWGK